MPYHNLQQLSDAVDELVAASGKSNEREANFIVSQVQPLNDRISAVEKAVTDLQSQIKAVTGK